MLEDDGCVVTGAGVGGMTFTGIATAAVAGFDFPLGVRSNVLPRTAVCCPTGCGAAILLIIF